MQVVRPGEALDAEVLTQIARRAGLAYFRVDADRNVVEMSPALERLTGFDTDDILGRSCLRVHRCTECLRSCGVFDQGLVTDKALELYRADGSTVRVRKSGRVFVDDQGAISGALEIVEPLHADEATRIRDALQRTRYNRTKAANLLGISRTTLWRKMKEHGL
jgi:PAS domain S-box-containing protein